MTQVLGVLWLISGLVFVTAPQIAVYLLTMLVIRLRHPGSTFPTGHTMLVASVAGSVLYGLGFLSFGGVEPFGAIGFATILIGVGAPVWIPLGNLVWRGVDRLCPCGA